jgi:hypothetical protein
LLDERLTHRGWAGEDTAIDTWRRPARTPALPLPAGQRLQPYFFLAKKATAKAPAGPKLRWRLEQERTPGCRAVEQTGVVGDAE